MAGTKITVRFETKAQMAAVRKAARLRDMSLNKFVIRTVNAAAEDELKTDRAGRAAEESLAVATS